MLTLLLAAQLATAQPVVHHEWWLHGAIFASGVSATADLSTTAWAMGRQSGFTEGNPLLRWAADDPVTLAVAKMSLDGAVVWLMVKHHPTHPRLVLTMAVAKTVLSVWAAHRNAQTVGLR